MKNILISLTLTFFMTACGEEYVDDMPQDDAGAVSVDAQQSYVIPPFYIHCYADGGASVPISTGWCDAGAENDHP